ncbi:MAG: PKD domain-containing protein [Flavobacteriales bacterium]|nr:PKD domain-containing protein [Flavobacteriales bacterium]
MAQRYLVLRSRLSLTFLAALALAGTSHAQLSVTSTGVPFLIDFDNTLSGVNNGQIDGSGFVAAAAAGDLDADAWATNGMSDGSKALGADATTGDHARGISAGGVTTGGFYAFTVSVGNRALGVQPVGADWTPGLLTLKVDNNTGVTVSSVDLSYLVYYFNDQGWSNSWNFEWSLNNLTWTPVGALDLATPAAAGAAVWTSNNRNTTINSLSLANGSSIYFRWASDDVSGSGSRDEIALDDISVTMNTTTTTTVQFTGTNATVSEAGVSTTLTVSISNPDLSNATTVDVVLTAGTAARIGGYTTQSLNFPAGSGASQNVSITLTDNGGCDGNELFTFQLQNVAGGNSAASAPPSSFNLTLTDNESSVVQLLIEDFETDGAGSRYTLNQPHGNPVGGDLFLRSDDAGMTAAGGLTMAGESGTFYMEGEDMDVIAPSAEITVTFTGLDIQGVSGTTISLLAGARAAANYDNAANLDYLFVERNVDGGGWVTVGAFRSEATIGGSNQRIALDTDLNGVGDGTQLNATMASFSFLVGATGTSMDVRIRFRTDASDEEIAFDLVEVEGDLCRPIYYSRANGSELTASWSTTRTGTAGAVTFDKNATGVIQTGNTITTTGATWSVYNLDVEAGGSAVLGTTNLDHYGTSLVNNSSFTIGTGAITFRNSGAVSVSGSGTYDLYDVTANNADVTLNSNLMSVRRTLEMTNGGTFNANNSGNPNRNLVLASSATGTGRLGPVSAGPSFLGQIRMERFVPAGITNWRLISAPTNGNALSSLEDDFVTAGYPGSEFPLFDQPVGSNILWPSIRTYDEPNAGPALIDGLTGATGDNMVMAAGQGFAAWSGTTLLGTSAFTIDLRSTPRLGLAPISLPVTYTTNGFPATDGWNLVGNPVPSPIDFTLVSKTNVDDFYYVFDPVAGNNASWDEGLGVSIPALSLNGNIQSFQGFWVKANAAAPTMSVEEGDKVLDLNGGGLFGGSEQGPQPMFRVELSSGINAFFDETLIHFGTGAPASGDAHDLVKFTFSHPDAPQIMSRTADGADMTLNAWGPITTATEIPVAIDVAITGDYTLRIFDAMGLMGMSCLVLEDLFTGQSIALSEGSTYTFTAGEATPAEPARFLVHASAPVQYSYTDVACNGGTTGMASALGEGTGPWDYTWMDENGTVLLEQLQLNGTGQFTDLPAGDYQVSVSSNAGCGTLVQSFSIDEPAPLDGALTATSTTCASVADGSVDLMVMGGTDPHTFVWSNGATTEDLTAVPAGTYEVTITDGNGCALAPISITVDAGTGPMAAFLPSTTTTFTGEPVEFFNMSTWGAQMTWDFGDGSGSTDNEPIHSYTLPGIYTVTLTVNENGCEAVITGEIIVDMSTGVQGITDGLARVWLQNDEVVVDLHQEQADEVLITVLDAQGRKVAERRTRITEGRERIPVGHVAQGVILVQLLKGDHGRTFKLPLTR